MCILHLYQQQETFVASKKVKREKSDMLGLSLKTLSDEQRQLLMNIPGIEDVITVPSPKDRSTITEDRIRSVMDMEKPSTTEYDFLFMDQRFELKQAEVSGTAPKFQQVKPDLYPWMLCMLNDADESRWYLLDTSKISSRSGKKYEETGKLTLQSQHKGNKREGQITPGTAFYNTAYYIGSYSPLKYAKEDLNISDEEIKDVFEKIEKHIRDK